MAAFGSINLRVLSSNPSLGEGLYYKRVIGISADIVVYILCNMLILFFDLVALINCLTLSALFSAAMY